MDPLSIVTGVVGISAAAVKLIVKLSEFVDDVQNVSSEVQNLANQLAAFYAVLGQVKLALQGPRHTPIPEQLANDLTKIIRDSETTLKELETLISKAKRAEGDRSATRVWKVLKFTFKTKQVEHLGKRIMAQNDVLGKMVLVLEDARGERIERRLDLLDEIHRNVQKLARENVKEILVVLEQEEESDPRQRGEFVLRDRTSRNQPSSGHLASTSRPAGPAKESGSTGPTRSVASAHDDRLVDWMASSAGQATFASAAAQLAQQFRLHSIGVGTGTGTSFTFQDRLAKAQLDFTVEEQNALNLARTYSWSLEGARHGRQIPSQIQRNSSRIGSKSLIAKIKLDRFLQVEVLNEKEEVVRDKGQTYRCVVLWSTITCEGRTVKMTLDQRWNGFDVPKGHACSVEYILLESALEAQKMCSCLQHLATLWMKAWELHTIAFSQVDESLRVNTEQNLRAAAQSEICAASSAGSVCCVM